MDDLSQLRDLLDTPWERGDTGKALIPVMKEESLSLVAK
jgi:hypothetical protein